MASRSKSDISIRELHINSVAGRLADIRAMTDQLPQPQDGLSPLEWLHGFKNAALLYNAAMQIGAMNDLLVQLGQQNSRLYRKRHWPIDRSRAQHEQKNAK